MLVLILKIVGVYGYKSVRKKKKPSYLVLFSDTTKALNRSIEIVWHIAFSYRILGLTIIVSL